MSAKDWTELGWRDETDKHWLQALVDAGYTVCRSDDGMVKIAKTGAPGWMTREPVRQ